MLIRGDARALPLAEGCVDCIVTSPPYFGLRDYGSVGQLGLEASPACYVAALVAVFRELWRVLKAEGTCWLNLGDSYAGSGKGGNPEDSPFRKQATNRGSLTGRPMVISRRRDDAVIPRSDVVRDDYKPKDLMMMPARVALALLADGWYLRSDIIWHKPNPMPESVTDRPTKSHEYLFLLTKSDRYYYDIDAIREPHLESSIERARHPWHGEAVRGHPSGAAQLVSGGRREGAPMDTCHENGRNKRTVWTIPTMPYSGAHFATMPEALVEPCILAGCPLNGLVLDPFVGSGTVVAVAERLGRRGVGVDLSYQDLAKTRTAQRGIRFDAEDLTV